jgi:hypothetical protein
MINFKAFERKWSWPNFKVLARHSPGGNEKTQENPQSGIQSWMKDMWNMNWKGCWGRRSWPNLQYYPGICLARLRKTTKILSQDSRFSGRDLNLESPEYKGGVWPVDRDIRWFRLMRRQINCFQWNKSVKHALIEVTCMTIRNTHIK